MRNVQQAKELDISPNYYCEKKALCPFSSFFSTLYHKLQGPLRDIQAHILGSGVRKLWSFQKMKSLESPSRL